MSLSLSTTTLRAARPTGHDSNLPEPTTTTTDLAIPSTTRSSSKLTRVLPSSKLIRRTKTHLPNPKRPSQLATHPSLTPPPPPSLSIPINLLCLRPSSSNTPNPPRCLNRRLETRLPRAISNPRLGSSSELKPTKPGRPSTDRSSQPSNLRLLPSPSPALHSTTPQATLTPSSGNTHSSHSIGPDQKSLSRPTTRSIPRSPQHPSQTPTRPAGKTNDSDVYSHHHPPPPAHKLLPTPFPSISQELTPKRPLTSPSSKPLLLHPSLRSSKTPEPSTQTGKLQIRRQPSRIQQITQALQRQVESKNPTHAHPPSSSLRNPSASHHLAPLTPNRRPSHPSLSSVLSTPDSSRNSPNITALAASLRQQHVQRDRSTRQLTSPASAVDMLRLSTMSTLGALKWEDGAGDILLTDPNETEAMVADISMTVVTPFKSDVQSAAVALASARANFLSTVQETSQTPSSPPVPDGLGRQSIDKATLIESPSAVGPSIRRRTSSSLIKPNGPSSLSRTRKINLATPSHPSVRQVWGRDSQVIALTESLELSLRREMELRKEIESLRDQGEGGRKSNDPRRRKETGRAISSVKRLSDQERERSLVEEIQRLEGELEESREMNIELENSLDLLKFEHAENQRRLTSLNDQHQSLLSKFNESRPSTTSTGGGSQRPTGRPQSSSSKLQHPTRSSAADLRSTSSRFEKYESFDRQIVSEIESIKHQLNLLHFIKVSLALSVDLLPIVS